MEENRLPDYIEDYPYNRFLMLRVEFLILCQNEIEAKIMRLIEWCIENKRGELFLKQTAKTPRGQKVVLPDEIWVAISHRFFLDQLQGTVLSETTLKEALASLEKKHLISRRPGGKKQYDAPEYTLNKSLISRLFKLFPKSLDEIDMISVMKQPRKTKSSGGQKLTPSIIDPLVQRIRGAIIDPLGGQKLTPGGPKIDPVSELGGGQKLTPKREEDLLKEETKDSSYNNPIVSASSAAAFLPSQLKSFPLEELIALRAQIDSLVNQQGNNQDTQPSKKTAPADEQNKQKDYNEKYQKEGGIEIIEQPERPAADAPRSAEIVVQLVEFLRGRRFERRSEQLRAAAVLLGIEPALSIAEIEEAWTHGSDDYWRERDPLGMTVVDLKNKERASGKYRVLACLEHKRRFEREQGQRSPLATPVAPSSLLVASEEQAQAIVAQIALDAQDYDVQASAQQHDSGWNVSVVWRSPFWPKKRDVSFVVGSKAEWQKEFNSWREILRMREKPQGVLNGSH